ncbi:MAG: glycoside hydrolase family 3 protein [Clostridia bacterium]|nr:glycoside hydrolase family 3 protein [Clostridia bacterium]
MKRNKIKRIFASMLMLLVLVQTGCNKNDNDKTENTATVAGESSSVVTPDLSAEPVNTAVSTENTENHMSTDSAAIVQTAKPTESFETNLPTSAPTASATAVTHKATASSSVTATAAPSKTATAVSSSTITAKKTATPTVETPKATSTPVVTDTPYVGEEITVQSIIDEMTLEEKVAQLFVVVPYALTDISNANAANETYKNVFDKYPVGGFCYMGNSIVSESQVKKMISKSQQYSYDRVGVPLFTCIDEEGGTVARIGNSGIGVPSVGNMCDIGASGDVSAAKNVGSTIGDYLSEFGFNVDFAPVADVLSNPDNTVVKKRSFGSDSEIVSDMALAVMRGLEEKGVYGTLKHFPGHGATEGDTHEGYAYTSKTLEELEKCELIPFADGIESGADFIMVGHISLPNIIGDNTPASLSHKMITEILREKMGYDGIIITDALNMGAITKQYSSAEAAVATLLAGSDMILMPDDFVSAYEGVLEAVCDGTVTEKRIDESLERILKIKLEMMN